MGSDPVLQFAVLAGLLLAVALALLVAIARRAVPFVLERCAPGSGVLTILWLLALPLLTGSTFTLLTLVVPAAFAGSGTLMAACAAHDQSLFHACIWHPTGAESSARLWTALIAAAVALGWAACRALGRLHHDRQRLAALIRLSRPWLPARNLHVVDTDRLLALACGFGARRILLSSSLLSRLSPQQLEVVLTHEQAHLRHRDALVSIVARALACFHFPAVRRDLLRALELAMEQRCDLAAARAVGSRLTVAETIVFVERALRSAGGANAALPAPAFANSFVYERVRALLRRDGTLRVPVAAWLTVGAAAIGALSAGSLHHLTESLLGLLAA